jgi:hypothetical protein
VEDFGYIYSGWNVILCTVVDPLYCTRHDWTYSMANVATTVQLKIASTFNLKKPVGYEAYH